MTESINIQAAKTFPVTVDVIKRTQRDIAELLSLLFPMATTVAHTAKGVEALLCHLSTQAIEQCLPHLTAEDDRELAELAYEGLEQDLRLHKKHFSRELEAQAIANEISKHLVRKQAETNDELRSQIATLAERCDSLMADNKKLRHIVRGIQHSTNNKLRDLRLATDNLSVRTIRALEEATDTQHRIVEMMNDGFDIHAKALLDLDEKTANAFNSVSKNEEATAQAIVSLRKQLGHPFPESSIFDGLLG